MSGGRTLRQSVHNRSKARYHYCGIAKGLLTVDHVVPLAEGGGWHITNLVGACSRCNSLKGSMSAAEFITHVLPGILERQQARQSTCIHKLNGLGHCTRCGARPNDAVRQG